MSREPSRQAVLAVLAVLAVRAVKTTVATAVAGSALLLTLGGPTAGPADAENGVVPDARCAGAAGKAIVRTHQGSTRAVPFEHAWQVYRGKRPGTLLTVCPDQ